MTTTDDRLSISGRAQQGRRVYWMATRVLDRQATGPAYDCLICGRAIGDPVSIDRGIGAGCWQAVLAAITVMRRSRDEDFNRRSAAQDYIAAVDRLLAHYAKGGPLWELVCARQLHDHVERAERALLDLLPAIVAPSCEMHDEHTTPRPMCVDCRHLQDATTLQAIGAALARLGLRDPWTTNRRQP